MKPERVEFVPKHLTAAEVEQWFGQQLKRLEQTHLGAILNQKVQALFGDVAGWPLDKGIAILEMIREWRDVCLKQME